MSPPASSRRRTGASESDDRVKSSGDTSMTDPTAAKNNNNGQDEEGGGASGGGGGAEEGGENSNPEMVTPEEAEKIIDDCEAENGAVLPVDKYNLVLGAYASVEPAKVERTLALMEKMESRGVTPDTQSHNWVLHALAHARVVSEVEIEKWMRTMTDKGIPVEDEDAYRALTKAYCQRCKPPRLEDAEALLDTMKESIGTNNECVTDCYSMIISAYVQIVDPQEPEKAERLLKNMDRDGLKAPTQVYNSIISCYTQFKVGRPDDAERIVKLMTNAGVKPDYASFSLIITSYSKSTPPRPDDAERVLVNMEQAGAAPRTFDYNFVISAFVHANPARPDDAMRVLVSMEKSGVVSDKVACANIINGFARLTPSRPDKAEEVFWHIQRRGIEIDGVVVASLLKAFRNSERRDDWLRALDIFDRCPFADRDAYVYMYAIQLLGKCQMQGKVMEALQEARRMCRPWPNKMVYEAAWRSAIDFQGEIRRLEEEDLRAGMPPSSAMGGFGRGSSRGGSGGGAGLGPSRRAPGRGRW